MSKLCGYCGTCRKKVKILTEEEVEKKLKPIKRNSAKRKGIGAQLELRNILAEKLNLSTEDIFSTAGGQTGVDLRFSSEAKKKFPFHAVEVANQQSLSIWAKFNQAEEHAEKQVRGKEPGNGKPILIFKRNHSKWYVMVTLDDFIDLVKEK